MPLQTQCIEHKRSGINLMYFSAVAVSTP